MLVPFHLSLTLYQRIYDNGKFYRKMIKTDTEYIFEKYLLKYMIELIKKY